MKILVTGDRNWREPMLIRRALLMIKPDLVIHGSARGADLMAEHAARDLQIEYRGYPAKWDEHGRSAGPRRNRRMLDDAQPDLVLWFHHDLDNSKGTGDMVREAQRRDITTLDGSTYALGPEASE